MDELLQMFSYHRNNNLLLIVFFVCFHNATIRQTMKDLGQFCRLPEQDWTALLPDQVYLQWYSLLFFS